MSRAQATLRSRPAARVRALGRLALGLLVLGLVIHGLKASASAAPSDAEPLLLLSSARREEPTPGAPVRGYEMLPLLRASLFPKEARAPGSGPFRLLTVSGVPLKAGAPIPKAGARVLGVTPGSTTLALRDAERAVSVVELSARRGTLPDLVDPLSGWLSLSRDLPAELLPRGLPRAKEAESVTFEVRGSPDTLPSTLEFTSLDANGQFYDSLRSVGLVSSACGERSGKAGTGESAGLVCVRTAPVRLVSDLVDRNHPAAMSRSVRAEVGGRLVVTVGRDALRAFRVGAPSALEPLGPGRYRISVSARVVRTYAGGPPAVGATDQEAITLVRQELEAASRMWGQCGFHLGATEQLDVTVVDPPELSLLTVGCERGTRASGGNIAVTLDGRQIQMRTQVRQTPESVASRLAERIRQSGLDVRVFRNALVGSAALATFDLVVTKKDGRPVKVTGGAGGLSSDPSLGVCLGKLDLADGLEHFHDHNAAAGTLEERLLLRALADENPHTIDLIVVPVFGGIGRIGESFIFDRGSSLQSALILDRTGIRAGSRSFTLAHELGHILLELPGHPDDFGVDTPNSLMDADAADSTIFGPRGLSISDCERALRQSGPSSPVRLIEEWPLSP